VATVVLLGHMWVADLYPWSTKRFLVYAVPLAAALAAIVPAALLGRPPRKWSASLAAGILVVVVLVFMARISWHAWHRTEYNGVSKALGEVAAQIGPDDIVFTDHHWWATPLTFIYDRQVFDGSKLWSTNSAGGRDTLGPLLLRLHLDGKRVRLLSSFKKASVAPDFNSEPVVLEEIIHRERASDYLMRTRRFTFQLSTWKPATL